MSALEQVPKPDAELDTTLLQLLVSQAESADLNLYLEAGKAELIEALESAKAVLENPQTQQQIDAAALRLHEAWLNLRLKPDESLLALLQETLEKVQAMASDFVLYADLREELQAWTMQAKNALENGNTDRDQVCSLIEQGEDLLSRAQAQKQINNVPASGTSAKDALADKTSAKAESIKTSVSSSAFGWSAALAACLALFAAGKKRR